MQQQQMQQQYQQQQYQRQQQQQQQASASNIAQASPRIVYAPSGMPPQRGGPGAASPSLRYSQPPQQQGGQQGFAGIAPPPRARELGFVGASPQLSSKQGTQQMPSMSQQYAKDGSVSSSLSSVASTESDRGHSWGGLAQHQQQQQQHQQQQQRLAAEANFAQRTDVQSFASDYSVDKMQGIPANFAEMAIEQAQEGAHRGQPGYISSTPRRNSQSVQQGLNGGDHNQCGIGVVFKRDDNDFLEVVRLIAGGPADESGLIIVGDKLRFVDGVDVTKVPPADFPLLIQGISGSPITLSFHKE